ncbi:MAG: ShlB/FhaC/HecB family hemolysin secretion/activation protein [Pseudomonadota bacterium]
MRFRFARLLAGSVLAAAVSSAWAAAPAADDILRFEITRFDVSGDTLLGAAAVNAAVAPFAGAGRDFGDVQRAVEALEAVYHARGYKLVTVRLPEQELTGGAIRLDVIQTRIAQVNVSGNTFVDVDNVRRSLPTLVPGQTPDLDRVSASLRMANENPARKIALKLQSAAVDDAVNANLVVTDEKPWKLMLNLDNTGTEETGKTHAGVVLQHANLWGRDHVGSIQYTTTAEEPGKVSVFGAGYHIPLYTLGDSVDLFASYSNIDSGSVTAGLFNLAVSGKGAVFGMRYNQTLARRGELDQRLVYGIDYKAFKNNVLFAGENFGNDITVHPLSLTWTGNMPWQGGDLSLSAGLSHNIPGGSRGGDADFARTRVGADASYSIVRLSAAFTRTLWEEWQGRVLLNGQYSSDALVPGEQFGAGGSSSVRGLSERAVSTDSGLFANLELYTPNLCGAGVWQCRALAFYDTAYGTRNAVQPGEISSTTVASTGLGVRVAFGATANLQIDYGHVVNAGATSGTSRNKVHVRMGFAY